MGKGFELKFEWEDGKLFPSPQGRAGITPGVNARAMRDAG